MNKSYARLGLCSFTLAAFQLVKRYSYAIMVVICAYDDIQMIHKRVVYTNWCNLAGIRIHTRHAHVSNFSYAMTNNHQVSCAMFQ